MLERPANQQNLFTLPLINLYDLTLPVARQEDSLVWLSTSSYPQVLIRQFTPGRLISLSTAAEVRYNGLILNKKVENGLVVQTEPNLNKVFVTGKLLDWWKVKRGSSATWINKTLGTVYASGNAAHLRAVCICPRDYQAGHIGWTLYYQANDSVPEEEIAKGTDLDNKSECVISLESYLWKPGIFTLRARRYQDKSLITTRTDIKVWTLSQNISLLSAGYEQGLSSPLYLNT